MNFFSSIFVREEEEEEKKSLLHKKIKFDMFCPSLFWSHSQNIEDFLS